jgi:hypothetical protein
MKHTILHHINRILRVLGFSVKLITTYKTFNWMGREYHLPLKRSMGYNGEIVIVDYFNNKLPLYFKNEEESRFVLNVLNIADKLWQM